jgi:hypothetical protein
VATRHVVYRVIDKKGEVVGTLRSSAGLSSIGVSPVVVFCNSAGVECDAGHRVGNAVGRGFHAIHSPSLHCTAVLHYLTEKKEDSHGPDDLSRLHHGDSGDAGGTGWTTPPAGRAGTGPRPPPSTLSAVYREYTPFGRPCLQANRTRPSSMT